MGIVNAMAVMSDVTHVVTVTTLPLVVLMPSVRLVLPVLVVGVVLRGTHP